MLEHEKLQCKTLRLLAEVDRIKFFCIWVIIGHEDQHARAHSYVIHKQAAAAVVQRPPKCTNLKPLYMFVLYMDTVRAQPGMQDEIWGPRAGDAARAFSRSLSVSARYGRHCLLPYAFFSCKLILVSLDLTGF